MVSTGSLTAITVSLVICFALPLVCAIFGKWKLGGHLKSTLLGALTFVVFALVLEQMFHGLMQTVIPGLQEKLWLRAAYGGVAAAVFEEFGRLVTMKYLMKGRLDGKEALMYGFGHGGIEAILITGVLMISNLVLALAINNGTLSNLVDMSQSANAEMVNEMVSLPSWQFLLGGVERISAFFLHVGLSMLVYLAISQKKKAYFVQALLVHFAVDAATVVVSSLMSVVVLEVGLLFVVILFLLYVRKLAQKVM